MSKNAQKAKAHITKITASRSSDATKTAKTSKTKTSPTSDAKKPKDKHKTSPASQKPAQVEAESVKTDKPTKSAKSDTKTVKTAKPAKKSKKSQKPTEKPLKEVFILVRPFVKLGRYLRDSWRELRVVRWPNRKATWKMTLAVLAYCALFLVFILLLDTFFTWLFNLLLTR